MAKAKSKRYDEGGVTEGQNKGIGDDTRARAMKWMQEQSEKGGSEESSASESKPTKAKASKAKAEATESKADARDAEAGNSRGIRGDDEPKTYLGATRNRTREEVQAAIPTGGKKGAGPTPGNGNSIDDTDTSRNLKNIASALTPMGGGVGKIGAELALAGRAEKAAEAAKAAAKATRAAREAKVAPRAAREAKTLNPNAWMAGPKGMKDNFKSGGSTGGSSVKGWGSARGARKAKIY